MACSVSNDYFRGCVVAVFLEAMVLMTMSFTVSVFEQKKGADYTYPIRI